jgi:hypothetical protein
MTTLSVQDLWLSTILVIDSGNYIVNFKGSILGHCGRIYVGDFVRYKVGTEIFSRKVPIRFMENNKIYLEIQKMLKLTHISTFLHGSA